MQQTRHILPLLPALFALLLTVFHGVQRDESVPAGNGVGEWESALTAAKHHVPEATLTDAAGLYRICSSRPQRIVSSRGAGSQRTSGSASAAARRHNVSPLKPHCDRRCRLET
ncbi:MAG: hypothetical protein IJT48_05345, partial [Bacteroidaceae bacterium]|nr:hypothetical protein [Bacteroidaceae bacterium]